MTRAEAVTAMGKFTSLAAAVGITTLMDDPSSIGPAINAALRALGFTESELAAADTDDDTTPAYLALLEYFVLDLFKTRAVSYVDIQVGGGQGYAKKRSQIFDHLKEMVPAALTAAQMFPYSVGGSDFVLGEISTNYLEALDASEL